MQGSVNFILCLHAHQPVGNFEHIFEKAYREAYDPFLEVMERFPDIKFSLHLSGTLLEWIERHNIQFFIRLRKLIEQGRVELIGGGFYEPIFTMIPERDAIGQIEMLSEYLHKNFGTIPRGVWIPERVWEPSLVRLLSSAKMQYSVLDDFHFKSTGLRDSDLLGYFITEDNGSLFKIFPLVEELRYAIPFKDPKFTISYLQSYRRDDGSNVIVYADDLEKFGIWPKTHKHVYEDGWLEDFLKQLIKNKEWLKTITFADAIDKLKPVGKIYLPSLSYREMGEWAILSQSQEDFRSFQEMLKNMGKFGEFKHFIPGGLWRNFRTKYPETNLMYARMLDISEKVDQLNKKGTTYKKAIRELYKAQCNCPYWHGVFGGVYLPHLRNSVFTHLLSAQSLLEEEMPPPDIGYKVKDFDLDTEDEVLLQNKALEIYISPAKGGEVFEIDLKPRKVNLLATISRRYEGYHQILLRTKMMRESEEIKSIHDIRSAKEENLEQILVYDDTLRWAFIDRFNHNLLTFPYVYNIVKRQEIITCFMKKELILEGRQCLLEKSISLGSGESSFKVSYIIRNLSPEKLEGSFSTEINFSLLNPESFYYKEQRRNLGSVSSPATLDIEKSIGVYDNWNDLDISLLVSSPAKVSMYPVNTVSQSESGFERILQGYAIVPSWEIAIKPKEHWGVVITYNVQ